MPGKVNLARALRRKMTDAERHLWKHLRLRNIEGFKFRRQHEIAPYMVDFICLEESLVIEIDGGQHADSVEYDTARTEFLAKSEYRVLRFWNNDVLQQVDGVVQVISDTLHGVKPPSPTGISYGH
jgi:adenine-specific DNA-methyltransferase